MRSMNLQKKQDKLCINSLHNEFVKHGIHFPARSAKPDVSNYSAISPRWECTDCREERRIGRKLCIMDNAAVDGNRSHAIGW